VLRFEGTPFVTTIALRVVLSGYYRVGWWVVFAVCFVGMGIILFGSHPG
jgi:hypothetical protein